jgi:hypothetical protein
MSLLAYSVRRAVGALIVLLILSWLLLFGVSHLDAPPNPGIPPAIFDHFYPVGRLQPDLANEWNGAALEVGLGVLVLLGLGIGWRLRKKTAT